MLNVRMEPEWRSKREENASVAAVLSEYNVRIKNLKCTVNEEELNRSKLPQELKLSR